MKATEWSKEYGKEARRVDLSTYNSVEGDLVHIDILGQHIFFLNTFEATIDLFDKRSSAYSDRVGTEMLNL